MEKLLSPFEYVSVAIALVYAMALGRLVSGISPSLRTDARYLVHLIWIAALILGGTLQWWMLWSARTASWTAPRFLFILTLPGILLIRAGMLLGEDPASVSSFREHFHRYRVRFYSLTLVAAVQGVLSPWVLGLSPWFSPMPVHRLAVIFISLAIAGLVFKGERVQLVLAALFLFAYACGFALVSGVSATA